jgi:hypothetical protein
VRVQERIRRSLAERPVGHKPVEVTLSGGVAAYPADGEEPAALVARADQALYLAKKLGKDRISLYHSERRCAVRYPARPLARASVVPRGRGVGAEGRLLNLSRSGLLLDVNLEPEPADCWTLTFEGRDAAGRQRLWNVEARVVRVDRRLARGEGSLVGLVFSEPLPEECLFQQIERTTGLREARGGRG